MFPPAAMNASRDTRLRALFDQALDLDGAAREALLARECEGDPELRALLQSMLAGADDEHFLARPAAPAPAADPFESPGTQIGPYRLLSLLGEGGFGRVFLAEQQEPVARRIALKIVKVGMDTRQVISRFEQERQALARMDHPHIARVLDAGATGTGRPYFVMELVTGEPLVTFCDRERLAIGERLELFGQVCRAVQHAHGKGVVHRDLKPGNVLVTRHDGRPHAKVIDFGIAKAMGQDAGEQTMLTEAHQVLGTLRYMSPEQADGAADIDTRTDVYSLGVLLYELLTGSTPFLDAAQNAAGLDELRRQFRDTDPARPSTRVANAGNTTTTIAADRRLEPRRLGQLLRGDLDWITMKALERDRNRRYATVDGLAADIEAHLAGEPVVAAPPSASYRLRKLLRRHAAAFASSLAVLVALLVGLIGFAWQAQVAADERDTARLAQREAGEERARATALAAAEAEQRQRAERSAATADAVNHFLLRMLGAANVRDLGRNATLVQALDRAAPAVDRTFADQPEVAAAVHEVLARSYLSLGRLEQADAELRAAEPLRLARGGEQTNEFAELLRLRAEWHLQRGERADAEAKLRRALTIATEAPDTQESRLCGLQIDLGNILCGLDRLDEAEALLTAGLAGLEQLRGAEHEESLTAKCSVAVLRQSQHRLDEAAALYREVLEATARRLGEQHVDTHSARMNLASVLMSQDRKAEAMPMLEAAYAGLEAAYGEGHTTTALAAWQLAVHHYDEGHYERARPLLERCVAIRREVHGEHHEATGKALELLALSVTRSGDPAAALTHFDAAVAAFTQSLGPHDTKTLTVRVHRANALVRADRRDEGKAELLALADLCRDHLGAEAPTTIIATNSYAVLLLGQNQYGEALPFLERALAAGRASPHTDPRDTVITELNLVSALREVGRLEEAAQHGDAAVAELLEVFGPDHPTTAAGRSIHAETLRRLGRLADARTQLEAALQSRRRASTDTQPAHGTEAIVLARVLVELGELVPAQQLLQEVEDLYTHAHTAEHRQVLVARAERGALYGRQQRFAEGESLLLDAEAKLSAQLPRTRRDAGKVRQLLADFYAAWQAAEPSTERAAAAASWRQRASSPP